MEPKLKAFFLTSADCEQYFESSAFAELDHGCEVILKSYY